MKIAIIGCGYVGHAMGKIWKSQGHHITATTRSSEKALLLAQEFDKAISCVGNDREALKKVIEEQDALLLCLAADDEKAYETTYLETAKALATVVPFSSIRQLIYTSSTSVYGEQQGSPVDETTLLPPLPPPIQYLAESEKCLLALEEERRKVCIFRLGEIYGPSRWISDRLRRLNGYRQTPTSSYFTNLIHLDDIVVAVDFALTHTLSGIYNLCNDVHIPRIELYKHLCQKHNLPFLEETCSKTNAPGKGNKIALNHKLKAAGFYPKITQID